MVTRKAKVEEQPESTLGVDEEILASMLKDKTGYSGTIIARKIMVELVKAERADFLLLREDDVRKWWQSEVKEQRKKIEARKERARINAVKRAAVAKLSLEERKALGLRITKAMLEEDNQEEV